MALNTSMDPREPFQYIFRIIWKDMHTVIVFTSFDFRVFKMKSESLLNRRSDLWNYDLNPDSPHADDK